MQKSDNKSMNDQEPKIETKGLVHYNKLNPRHKQFAKAYADPKSKTYSNGVQSYKQAYDKANNNTAGTNAHQLLKTEKMQQSIEELTESLGMGMRVRLNDVNSIIRQSDKVKVEQEHYDADDNLTHRTVTTRDVSPQDRLKAVNLVNKMTGMYDRNRETAKAVGREVGSLIAKFKGQGTK